MNERKLTASALNQLAINTGLVGNVKEHKAFRGKQSQNNALIMFEQSEAKLIAELRNWASDNESRTLIRQLQRSGEDHEKVLICDYINEELGRRLREAKVNYLDKAGNAFLELPPLYVSIQGKEPAHKSATGKSRRLFTEPGLKVIFALLTNPDLLNSNYRQIANSANVTMGAIGWVLNELKEEAYIVENQRVLRWMDRPRLLKKWVEEYPTLRKKVELGKYYTQEGRWWESLSLSKYDAVLGGEVAAYSYCGDCSIDSVTIYVGKNKQASLVRDLQLVAVEDLVSGPKPNVEILSRFWGCVQNDTSFSNLTHPLLTHADLIDTWDPKSRTMAARIADLYLQE